MVDINYQKLSVTLQCKLLNLSRSGYYYHPATETDYNLLLMKLIDREYLKYRFFGSRRMKYHLAHFGYKVSRHRVRRLMQKMGLVAIYQKPKTTCSGLISKTPRLAFVSSKRFELNDFINLVRLTLIDRQIIPVQIN